jgi:hypothetical protein
MPAAKNKTIPVDLLKIDDHYQRLVRPAHVAKIVANYDPRLFGALTVNDRSGVLFVIDGGHRLAAAKELGLTSVPCHVLTGLTSQEEAGLFYHVNINRLKANSFERFVSLRHHGDPHALEIDALIRKNGWTPSATYGIGNVHALAAVEGVYNRDGAEGLDETLGFIKRTWNGSDRATEGQMIRGVAHFLRYASEKVDLQDVSRKLAMTPPAHIIADALYKNRMQGGGVPANVARKLLDEYNKGRKAKVRVAM